jgi:hypothetical protein
MEALPMIHPVDLELTPTLTIEAAIERGAAIYEVRWGDRRPSWVARALYEHCSRRRLPFVRVSIHRSRGTAAVHIIWHEHNQPSVEARLAMESLAESEDVGFAQPEVCSRGVWIPALPLYRAAGVVEQLRRLAMVGPSWEAQ